jgi:hypothetical protein
VSPHFQKLPIWAGVGVFDAAGSASGAIVPTGVGTGAGPDKGKGPGLGNMPWLAAGAGFFAEGALTWGAGVVNGFLTVWGSWPVTCV